MSSNQQLNLNRARLDKYTLVLSTIPSAILLSGSETEEDMLKDMMDEDNTFRLSLQTVDLPGVSLGESKIQTTFSPVAHVDMSYTFDAFTTGMRVDSNYIVYKLMLLWLHLIKNPEGFNQYDNKGTFEKTAVNGSLIVRGNIKDSIDSDYTPVMQVDFFDLRPISVPAIPFSYANEGDEISLNVTWIYSYFMPRKSNGDAISLILPSFMRSPNE
jgi:hypothetical protein